MSQSTSTKSQFITPETYDFERQQVGKANKNKEYGFIKRKLKYTRDDVDNDDNVIKFQNFQVAKVYPPKPEHKTPKYSVIFVSKPKYLKPNSDDIEDEADKYEVNKHYESTRTFCEAYNDYILKHFVEHCDEYFDDSYNEEELDVNYKRMFKIADDSISFTVSFPFNSDSVNDDSKVRVAYMDKQTPSNVIQSTDLEEKLTIGCHTDVFLHLTNFYQDDTDKFRVQSTIFKRIHVTRYQKLESLGGGSGNNGFNFQDGIDELDLDDIVVGTVHTNDNQGRSLKPKIKYTNSKGEDDTKNIVVGIQGDVRFVKFEDTKNKKTNFSVVYNPTDEEIEKFEAFSEHLKADLFKNFGKYNKGEKITKKGLDKQFRSVVGEDKEGNKVMWFTVYAKDEGNGNFDFSGNFYRPDGTKYSNDEVFKLFVEPDEYSVRMNIYFKHIWFGKYYSCKFNMGSVELDIKTGEYDFGGEPIQDVEPSDNTTSNDNDDLNDDEPENSDVESEPSDAESEPSDNEDESD